MSWKIADRVVSVADDSTNGLAGTVANVSPSRYPSVEAGSCGVLLDDDPYRMPAHFADDELASEA
uniref:hypothetical protein n=1 Tax=Streptomyces tubercidicus TaxID=47759 RepID=UPI0030E44F2C|nr:hypothetical protein OG690_38205 [Streptomyces tubercidicus]